MGLLVDECVGLPHLVPPFAVAEAYVLAAGVDEHVRADLAGERAGLFVIAMLSAQTDRRALHRLAAAEQARTRRTHRDRDAGIASESLDDRRRQQLATDRRRVHLPVAGDEFFTHGQWSLVIGHWYL